MNQNTQQYIDEILQGLNPEQRKAVLFDQGPLMLVAGAGTGKTKVITTRIAYLMMSGKAKLDQILALTFSEKATNEMDERLDIILPYGYFDRWVMTFHAFGKHIVEEHAFDVGLSNSFTLLDSTQAWLLVKRNLKYFKFEYYKQRGNPDIFIQSFIRHVQKSKEESVYPEQYQAYAEHLAEDLILDPQEVERVKELAFNFNIYQQLLYDNNALDYSDLLGFSVKILEQKSHIRSFYQQKFKYIVVDEFQDTNRIQYKLIKLLLGVHENIAVIGDDDQSIYAFRGSSINNILEFKDDFPQAQEIFMTQNYRSHQEILDLSYTFIQQNNPYRLEVKLAALAKEGQKLSKKLTAFKGSGGTISVIEALKKDDERQALVQKILTLKNSTNSWNDFAILLRTNGDAEDIIACLDQHGIPNIFFSNQGLYCKDVILDLLAYVKLLDNYHESASMYRVLLGPMYNVSAPDLSEITFLSKKSGVSLYAILKDIDSVENISDLTKEQITNFLTVLAEISQYTHSKDIIQMLRWMLEKTGYHTQLLEAEDMEAIEIQSYINQFLKRGELFGHNNPGKTIIDFAREIDLEIRSGNLGDIKATESIGDYNVVNIMTIHASKGLEFEYVFIPYLNNQKFPSKRKSEGIPFPEGLINQVLTDGDAHKEEERRLFYVAMTRAKQGLYLSYHTQDDRGKKKKPSEFVLSLENIVVQKYSENGPLSIDPDRLDRAPSKVINNKKSYSHSQITVFKRCPLQYKYKHVLNIATFGNAQTTFGKVFHSTMESFFRNGKTKALDHERLFYSDLEELIQLYKNNWIEEWYENSKQRDEFFEYGLQGLTQFHQTAKGVFPVPYALEYPMVYLFDQYKVTGVVDRIDQKEDGSFELLDYKTGKPPKPEQDGSYKLPFEKREQLLLYAYMFEALYNKPVSLLTYYYLEGNQFISFEPKPKDKQRAFEKLLKGIQEIQGSDYAPKPSPFTCKTCDFYSICAYKKM